VRTEVLATAEDVARRAAALVAEEARAALRERGRFLVALSGGATPRRMFDRLANEAVPWPHVHIFQVDERVVASTDPARNLRHLRASLLDETGPAAARIHPMPVDEVDLAVAASRYAATLCEWAGDPPVLDLVHLGLGGDGHTASLAPGDPALEVRNADVAVTSPYEGHRRMTLTFPALDRARRILWLVTGAEKREILAKFLAGDRSIPAARVAPDHARLLADAAAMGHPG
jgi:6-phosphogluconolactonase